MRFRLIIMFAADAYYGHRSRGHFVFQVQAKLFAATALLEDDCSSSPALTADIKWFFRWTA
jgi:hypothetical protein